MKNKIKILLAFILGILVAGTGVYAATTLASSSVAYDNSTSGGSSTNVKGALDELYEVAIQCPSDALCAKAKVGDYVKMTPTQSSATISSESTGYDSNQSINPSELNLWRIIRINTDGTIEMVSQYVSSTNIYFYGKTGFYNFVGTMNFIASQYNNSAYTKNVRPMGYNGQTATITTLKTGIETTVNNDYETVGGGDLLYLNDYNLVIDVLGNAKAYKVGTSTSTAYWLGARSLFKPATSAYVWGGQSVSTTGGITTGNQLYYLSSGASEGSKSYAIRPIATLRPEIITSSGAGTSSSPWVLG